MNKEINLVVTAILETINGYSNVKVSKEIFNTLISRTPSMAHTYDSGSKARVFTFANDVRLYSFYNAETRTNLFVVKEEDAKANLLITSEVPVSASMFTQAV